MKHSSSAVVLGLLAVGFCLAGCQDVRQVNDQNMYSGAKYTGGMKNVSHGRPEGYGVIVYSDGRKYEGNWSNGEFDGHGKMTSPAGTSYEGEFRNGLVWKAHGTVVQSEGTEGPDGAKYTGTWDRDTGRGSGTIVWKDGRKYEGQWLMLLPAADLPDGEGTMTWPDGRTYTGDFRNGQPHPANAVK